MRKKKALTQNQRHLMADKFWELANFAMAGLVFGSVLTTGLRELKWDVVLPGSILYFLLAFVALKIGK